MFEVYKAINGDFRWRITSGGNNKIIGASSEGFKNREDCLYNATLVRDALVKASK